MKGNEQMVTNSHQENYIRVKKAVPAILLFFVFALVIDNSFKLISPAMATDLGVSATTISWQATLAGLIIGIGAVVYASLSDSISIRNLLITGVILICVGSVTGGFISTYLDWTILFLIPLLSLLLLPFFMKYIPKEESKKSSVDVIGLMIIAATATSIKCGKHPS